MPTGVARMLRGAMVILDQGLYSLATFVTSVMVARTGGSAALAYYALAQTVVTSSFIVLRCLVGVPYTVLSAGTAREARDEYFSASVVFQAALAAAGCAIVASIAAAGAEGSALGTTLLALAVAGPPLLLRDFVRSYFLAALEIGRTLWISALSNTVGIGIVFLCFWHGSLSPAKALLALGAGAALPVLRYIPRRFSWPSRAALMSYSRQNWRFGRHTLAANALSMALAQAVPWVLLATATHEAVAQLAAATGMTGLLRPVIQGLSAYLTPLLARSYAEGGRAFALARSQSAILFMAVLSIPSVAIIAILGAPLIKLVYGVELSDKLLIVFVTLSVAMESIAVVLRATVRAIHAPAEETIAAGWATLFGTIAAVTLLPLLNETGAAAALAANQCAFVAVCLFRIKRQHDTSQCGPEAVVGK